MNQPLLYSKNNGMQLNDAEFVLDNYFRLIKWNPEGGDSILDVGCGPGDATTTKLLPQVPKNVGMLVGADLSQEMVDFARSQNRHPKVRFSIIDIASRKLQPECYGQFEHLFSFYCLHWIQDQREVTPPNNIQREMLLGIVTAGLVLMKQFLSSSNISPFIVMASSGMTKMIDIIVYKCVRMRQAFKNIYNLLKPGGYMLVTILATHPIFYVYENMSTSNKWMEYLSDTSSYISPYHKRKDPEQVIENLLGDIGFSTHLCNVIERKYVYTDLTVFRNYSIAINPFIGKIPDDLHNDYMDDFIDEMRNMNFIEEYKEDENNKVIVWMPYKLIVIVACKPY